ncbi:MAG: hypothetical protein DSY77_05115 [Bacteroidetes bacterium]|nr:MAG: hypothetical protein DSY77_05115 [Bacteroidota bacterium]
MKALLLIEKLRLVEFIEYFATKKLSQSYYSAPEALVIITIQRMAIEKKQSPSACLRLVETITASGGFYLFLANKLLSYYVRH